jgi:hypothetical protein
MEQSVSDLRTVADWLGRHEAPAAESLRGSTSGARSHSAAQRCRSSAAPVISRLPRPRVTYEYAHLIITTSRF